ncbi:bile acid:sodium symporter [Parasphingorhabdus cellanae]|uniref:Bile acid:sodium symporter n=1 Tax=Parasphingorhabdus cellanae TaxID=2806553 RepID=A0ABX7T546_9SPHN|nr:bile acid:sodium symporter [Parasphingorhabdus cellanae]
MATLFPVRGTAEPIAAFAVSAGIFWIFLLHGIRLDRQEVVAGFRNWRLQSAVFGYVFGAMVVAGFILSRIVDGHIAPMIAVGFLYLGCLPSTIQSAASYTAIAKGNMGASVVAAATVNLSSIIITPVVFALLASSVGIVITGGSFVKIITMLLLPFVIGQLIQGWARPWVAQYGNIVGWSDKIAISLAVYVAFSGAVVAGIWQQVPGDQFLIVAIAITALLMFAFGGAWLLGGIAGFALNDRKALLFGGAQKSIAVGAPLAAILFPPENAGLLLIPLLFYHLSSLVLSAPLAVRLSKS